MRRAPDALAWVAAGLVGAWCALAFLSSLFEFAQAWMSDQHFGPTLNGPSLSIPGIVQVGMALFVLQFLALNLLFPGLVVGTICIVRSRERVMVRIVSWILLVAGGVVSFVAISQWHVEDAPAYPSAGFLHDGRGQRLLELCVPVLVAVGVWVVLRLRPPAQKALENKGSGPVGDAEIVGGGF